MDIKQEMGPVAPYWNGLRRGAGGEFGNRVMVHGFPGNAGSLLMERMSRGESVNNR